MNCLEKAQDKVLSILAGKVDEFYLADGTALAKFYFHHRTSEDLDFFTQTFNYQRIQEVKNLLAQETKQPLETIREKTKGKNMVKLCMYYLPLRVKLGLKIDFVEDYLKPLKDFRRINGINVLSLEDIYLRKIYTICGTEPKIDIIGRKIHLG